MRRRALRRRWLDNMVWVAIGVLGIVLLLAAYGKLFYPTAALQGIDRFVGGLECVFFVMLLMWRRSHWVWLSVSMMLASWGGYALYWYLVALPCGCFGDWMRVPTLFTLGFDGICWIASLFIARFVGATRRCIVGSALAGIAFATLCFFIARTVHHTLI